ncbi:MAG: hypothetical protein WD773_10125 [Gemmatimonadales bacterium]
MLLRLSVAAAILVAGIACASRSRPASPPGPAVPPPPPAPPGPPAPRPAAEVIRLGPSALRYVAHQVIHIEQEFQGMRQPLDFGLRIFFGVTITGPADSVGYVTTVTIDSVVPDSGTTAPMGINLAAAKGLSFTGRLTPTAEFRNPVASDTLSAQALGPIVGSFKNFFPRLPPGGLTLGASWTDTVVTSDRAAGNVEVRTISRANAAAWEERNGVRCIRLEVLSNFTIQGAGEQGGQPFEVAGTGIRNGVDYIAVDGRYMGGEARDSTTMTITLPVQAMIIPRTQVSHSTVTVRQ